MAELGLALGRAEEKTERLQARAYALDALIDADLLAPPWGGGDPIAGELRQLVSGQAAEAELASLKLQLAQAEERPALDHGFESERRDHDHPTDRADARTDLDHGQIVIVTARWIMIAIGLVLSIFDPTGTVGELRLQVALILLLGIANFYLHAQLLRRKPIPAGWPTSRVRPTSW